MDTLTFIYLFLLGALGALLIVYLAKQQVIPEFRPLHDIADSEAEIKNHQEHINKLQKEIDTIQENLQKDEIPEQRAQRLETVLKYAESELIAERQRLQVLERKIAQSQNFQRGLGFFLYIVLGGAFGALLAGKVTVMGLDPKLDLPKYFESIIIGATWTTFLSTIGVNINKQDAKDKSANTLDAVSKKIDDKFEELKKLITGSHEHLQNEAKNLAEQLRTPLAEADHSKDFEDQLKAVGDFLNKVDKTSNSLASNLDVTKKENQWLLDSARQSIERDFNAI